MRTLMTLAALLATATTCLAAIPPEEKTPPRLPEANADAKKVAASSNAFAFDLYATLKSRNGVDTGNLFYSPYSITAAMTMVREGAVGKTAEEITTALHLPAGETTRSGFDSLLTRLQATPDKSGFSLAVANRLWPQQNFDIKPDYLKLTQGAYHAGIQPLDFANAAASAKTINDWVEAQTNNRIKDLVPASALDASTRLVLTNAIYFKGDWKTPFKEAATTDGDFAAPGKKVTAKLMHHNGHFPYAAVGAKEKAPAFQALELPYGAGDLSMVVLLPAAGELGKLEAALSDKVIDSVTSGLREQDVRITFPRFKLEDSFNLNAALQAVGVKTAFTGSANFSNITTKEGLAISDVIHKSFVEVNEKGTEAAAATAVIMKATAAMRPEQPITFVADHPFLFLIRDRGTGAILFLGRLNDPAK